MVVQTRTIDYTDGGTGLEGYFAWDDAVSGARPGVLVVHAWAGRSPFEEEVARKLAALGYKTIVISLDVAHSLRDAFDNHEKLVHQHEEKQIQI